MLSPLNAVFRSSARKNDPTPINWSDELREVFQKSKAALSEKCLLTLPDSSFPLILHTDASAVAIGASLNQIREDGVCEPLGFFSRKLTPTQQKYSTYDREHLAIYVAIKYFLHLVEGRSFTVQTDHKPLVYAYQQKPDKASPRQFRYLEFIAQYTTDIRYINGDENLVADALSRIDAITHPASVQTLTDEDIAKAQRNDPELQTYLTSSPTSTTPHSLKIQKFAVADLDIYCDVSKPGYRRPFVPEPLRYQIFLQYHGLAHPGVKRTRFLISKRFVWPNLKRDVGEWTRICQICQRSKITKHTSAPLSHFDWSPTRLDHVHIDLIGPLPVSNGNRYCLTMIDRATRWPEVTR